MVELKRQADGLGELCFACHFADAHGGALVRRLHKQRQTQFSANLREAVLVAVGAGERDERRDIQPGVAQQAFGDVFVHARGGAEYVRADERQVGHAQHPLQRTIFPQRAVHDREDHVDLGECLSIAGIDKLPLRDAGYGGDANF